MYQMGDIVKITTGYFANEAFTVATGNKIKEYTGIGKIVKIPCENDHILTVDETDESEMIDNYHVVLEVSPYNYNWNKTVTYLEENDLEKV
jgi:hypothetical protein